MKLAKSAARVLFVSGLILLLASPLFAQKNNEQEKIKLLNDAAKILQQSNSHLAQELTKFANEEAMEKKGKNEKNEPEGIKEVELEKLHTERIKLLKDSAAALQQSHHELADKLVKMANRMAKRMAEKKEGKEDTREIEKREIKH